MKMKRRLLTAALTAVLVSGAAHAQNPIVQTCFTADPAPMVHDGRMYVYIDRDEGPDWYVMNEWRVYSSADMVNWTDHGAALPLTEFAWSTPGSAWASQCIERNGKFYWYVCCTPQGSSAAAIGVAVSDSPTGPFKDALGKPMIEGGWGYIDPSPYIDDDGQAYLYWGNPGCYYVKLNEDMISYSGDIVEIEQTEEAFGGPKEPVEGVQYKDLYEEGPWFWKRNGLYYLMYAAGGVPEHIAYSTSDSPIGPWKYAGQIMPLQDTGSFTNHSGVADFKGHSYFFYHTGWLPGGGGFNRSICVEEFQYNADGTIPTIMATREGVDPVGTLNPYERVEAETMAWGLGLATEEEAGRGVFVTSIDDGDSLKVREVDFGATGAGMFTACVACTTDGGTVEIRLDAKDGPVVATLPVSYTAGEWKEFTIGVDGATGKHDVWLVFKGEGKDLFRMDYWRFAEKKSEKTLTALNATVVGFKIDCLEGKGNTATLKVLAVYADGTTEDVTAQAEISAKEGRVSVSGSIVTGLAYGDEELQISYGGLTAAQPMKVRSYDAENSVQSVSIEVEGAEDGQLSMMPGEVKPYKVIAVYNDGREEDVTGDEKVDLSADGCIQVRDGLLTALENGEVELTVSVQGLVGEAQTAVLVVKVETIPLNAFNPAIWTEGTYDKETHTYVPGGEGGFGGWEFSGGQDWSSYRYLTVELEDAPVGNVCFQIWDKEGYFDAHSSTSMQGKTTLSVDLHALSYENDSETLLSPEHIYRIGFWQWGTEAVTIKSVRLERSSAGELISLDDLNPSIWDEGTYDRENHVLVTGQYGFGGWEYDPALDLSGYDYLVVELAEEQTCGAQFRFWDEEGYFAPSANYAIEGRTLRVNLKALQKEGEEEGVCCDPSHITRMGFWSFGGSPISIQSIYLIEGSEPDDVHFLAADTAPVQKAVDVYTLSGVKVRSGVCAEKASEGLPAGIYIIGKRKVAVGR